MKIESTPLAGVNLVTPTVHGDKRGFFLETWHADRYTEAGITLPFVQDNHSRSARGILRGLHLQTEKPQGKLVQVLTGSVFDVVVDCRPDSPSFGKWHGVTLSAENHQHCQCNTARLQLAAPHAPRAFTSLAACAHLVASHK